MTRDEIIQKLEKGSGLNRDLDIAIWEATETVKINRPHTPKYTESLDAAIDLVERMRPGWDWYVRHATSADGDVKYGNAQIWPPCNPRDDESPRFWANHDQPVRALLIALFRALTPGNPT